MDFFEKELNSLLEQVTDIQDKVLDQAMQEYSKDNIDNYFKCMDMYNNIHPIAYRIYNSLRYIKDLK